MLKVGDIVRLKGGKRVGVVVSNNPDIPERVGCVIVRWENYPFDTPVKAENLVAKN